MSQIEGAIGKCGAGDQLLIFFQGHGTEISNSSTTHHFVTEDKTLFNMDWVGPPLRKLGARGCQTALIDLSCYSGNTQNLTEPNTYPPCIVTLASRNYVSVCADPVASEQFTNAFINGIRKHNGESLEGQFLMARRQDQTATNLPQISSIPLAAQTSWDRFLRVTDPAGVEWDGNVRSQKAKWRWSAKSGEQVEAAGGQAVSSLIFSIRETLADPSLSPQQRHGLSTLILQLESKLAGYYQAFVKNEEQKSARSKNILLQNAVKVLAVKRELYDFFYGIRFKAENACTKFAI